MWSWGAAYNVGPDSPELQTDGWREVAVGPVHTCRINFANEMFCDGAFFPYGSHPGVTPGFVQFGPDSWLTVSVGDINVCGIQFDESLWCWGDNVYGQVGDGTTDYRNQPVQIGAAETWRQVDVGVETVCATTTTSKLFCWGRSDNHNTASGSADPVLNPTQVGDAEWLSADTALLHSCGIKLDRTLWCWGADGAGNTGLDRLGDWIEAPAQVGSAANWSIVDADFLHACGLRTDGTLWCWGTLEHNIEFSRVPVQIGTDDDWTQLAVGMATGCALKRDASMWCWGENDNGAIGDGTTIDRPEPVQIGADKRWAAVSISYYSVEALEIP